MAKTASASGTKTVIRNRKARYDYEILAEYEAGIALQGTEIKSIRAGKCNMGDAFCLVSDSGQLEVLNMHISPYEFGNRANHEPKRKRVLLMHKKEIRRLHENVKQKGLSLIPLKLYFKGPYLKLSLGLCRGKKRWDKRESIRERDSQRDAARTLRNTLENG